MEDDADYMHAKRVGENFEKKELGKYHDLLADTFENFQNMCFETYELDSSHFSLIKG